MKFPLVHIVTIEKYRKDNNMTINSIDISGCRGIEEAENFFADCIGEYDDNPISRLRMEYYKGKGFHNNSVSIIWYENETE